MRNIELKQDIHTSGIADISEHIKFPVAPSEINIRFKPNNSWAGLGSAELFGIRFVNEYGQYIEAAYDVYKDIFYLECMHSSSSEAFVDIPAFHYSLDKVDRLDMKIVLDSTSVQLFAMEGAVELSNMYFYSAEFNQIELFAETGKVFVELITIKKIIV